MIVVSDTSPISALFRIGYIHLLHALYGKVIIPTTVQQELNELVNWGYDPQQIFLQPWVEVHQCQRDDFYFHLCSELDEGEAEAIALAKNIDADILLIDELKGRKIAVQENLKIVGVLGVLLDAKEMGLVDAVKPMVDDLIHIANFRIDVHLYYTVLTLANEDV